MYRSTFILLNAPNHFFIDIYHCGYLEIGDSKNCKDNDILAEGALMLIQHKNVGQLKELRGMFRGVVLSVSIGLAACGGGGGGDTDLTESPPPNVCGQIITENTTLQTGLICPGDAPSSEVNGVGVTGGFVRVHNIELRDGMIRVAFGFDCVCDTAKSPSNGEVLKCPFTEVYSAPIYINCSTDELTADNEMSMTIEGGKVDADAHLFGAITGLLIENNTSPNGFAGVVFGGATDLVLRC